MSDSLRVVVKDAIDVVGTVTGAGCRAVAESASPARTDAACLAGFRAATVRIVGKATLDELCITASGRNDWLGTPPNPLGPLRVVGGSSSGSAVAVAVGAADIALGTDTGGSVRVPAACCGVVGLKTTWGRVPLGGVWPTAPTLDTVGPLARDVAGVARAMTMLAPTWQPVPATTRVGRLRVDGVDAGVEAAVDDALRRAGLDVVTVGLDAWAATAVPFGAIFLAEFWQHHQRLLDRDGVGGHVARALRAGAAVTPDELRAARTSRQRWIDQVDRALTTVDVIALPTLPSAVPARAGSKHYPFTLLTAPLNVAGVPALSLPVPSLDDSLPASLQLFARAGGEELLCATGAVVEAAQSAPARPEALITPTANAGRTMSRRTR